MRCLLSSGLAGFALLCCASAVFAQTATPTGSYAESCQEPRMKGTTLQAKCQTAEGKLVPARLEHADQCADGVVNLNGILSCQSGTIPPGSYLSSCTDPRIQGTTLRATCKTDKGSDFTSELRDANRCTGDVANKNGSLRCISSAQTKASTPEEKKEGKKKRHLWPLGHSDKS